jgi:pantothenate kinase
MSEIEWQRYHALIEKRQTETLTPEEHEELITLSDQLEEANVDRIRALADLAQLRQTSINALMAELNFLPRVHV